MANWHYINKNGEKITVTSKELKQLALQGTITPETIVETEEGKTAPARKVKGLTFAGTTPSSETYSLAADPSVPQKRTPNSQRSALDIPDGTHTGRPNPPSEASVEPPKCSWKRTIGFGCLYAFLAYLVIGGIIGAILAPRERQKMLEKMNESSAEFNSRPLFVAARDGDIETVRTLVANGTDVNEKINEGHTALHETVDSTSEESVEYVKIKIAEILVANGADVNAKRGDDGETPLSLAIYGGKYLKLAEFLLRHGADVNTVLPNGYPIIFREASGDAIRKASDATVGTVEENTKAAIELLIAHGADVNQICKGDTPLLFAAYTDEDTLGTVRTLISKGAKINVRNSKGNTPLYETVGKNRMEEVINLRFKSGKGLEMRGNHVAELLLEHGADVNSRNSGGDTPLHKALRTSGHGDAELLLSKGADVNAKNDAGDTPLHEAVRRKKGLENLASTDDIELLISKGAVANVQNNAGDTPLRIAERQKNWNIAEYLAGHKKK